MADLSIIIVNWNVCDLLRRCLKSIVSTTTSNGSPGLEPQTSGLDLEVIVVDNGSTDGSVQMVQTEFPNIHLITNSDNRGFAAANNQGIGIATGKYVLLLNPDTEVVGDALTALVTFAGAHPDVAIIGPQLLNPDGSVQPSRRRFPTFATALFESTWLQPVAPRRLLDRYYVHDRPDDQIQDVDWVDGAALLAQREVIEQVGKLDEGFFMYSEEMDWCRSLRDAGWRVVYLPDAQIVHYRGKSSEQAVVARHVNFQTSKVRYFRKHHGAATAEALRLFLLSTYVWQMGLEGAKWLIGHNRPLRSQRVDAYRQVLRSGLRAQG